MTSQTITDENRAEGGEDEPLTGAGIRRLAVAYVLAFWAAAAALGAFAWHLLT